MSKRHQYFRKFPVIDYNGASALNILRRVDINTLIKSHLSEFYPYTVLEDQKIEHIAFDYYDDVDFDWLLYHVNDITDPYFEVTLNSTEFSNFIEKKYGSSRKSTRKTHNYINNYEDDLTSLSSGSYEALTGARKKYWTPVYNTVTNKILSYERSKEDFTASTNMIMDLNFSSTSTGTFDIGEVISIRNDDTTTATVTWANTTTITIQDIVGDFSTGNIIGDDTGATATIDSTSEPHYVIPEEELIYYKRQSSYQYEFNLNEAKRNIYVLQHPYKEAFNKQLNELMSKA